MQLILAKNRFLVGGLPAFEFEAHGEYRKFWRFFEHVLKTSKYKKNCSSPLAHLLDCNLKPFLVDVVTEVLCKNETPPRPLDRSAGNAALLQS